MSYAWSTRQVAECSGIPYDLIDYYTKRDILLPSVAPGKGKGSVRQYGFNDLVALEIIRLVRPLGMDIAPLKPLLKMVQQHTDLSRIDHDAYAFIDGCCHGIISELSKAHGSGCSLVFDLRLLADRILKRVAE